MFEMLFEHVDSSPKNLCSILLNLEDFTLKVDSLLEDTQRVYTHLFSPNIQGFHLDYDFSSSNQSPAALEGLQHHVQHHGHPSFRKLRLSTHRVYAYITQNDAMITLSLLLNQTHLECLVIEGTEVPYAFVVVAASLRG